MKQTVRNKKTAVHLATNEWWIYIFRKKQVLPIKSLRNRSAKSSFCQPIVKPLNHIQETFQNRTPSTNITLTILQAFD